MRIISGKHRGRRIDMLDDKTIRPTSGRTREAIFNILAHADYGVDGGSPLDEAMVVDIFCGSGALGLEALSRGAKHVTFIDKNQPSLSLARQNAEKFGEIEQCAFIRNDSTQLPPSRHLCTLAFADPPYNKAMAVPALKSLASNGWLAPDAVVVMELSSRELIEVPSNYTAIDERVYGNSKIVILRYEHSART